MPSSVSLARAPQNRMRGFLYGAGAGLAGSLGGISIRLVEDATLWQMAVFRYATVAILVFLFCWYEHRRNVFRAYVAIGWVGVIGGLLMAGHHLAYVAAMLGTTVANAAFVLSTTPILSALLGIAFIKERVRPMGWLAIVGTMIGMGVMVGGGLSGKGLFGMSMAFLAALTFAAYVVLVRASRRTDMVPSMSIGAVLASATGILLANGDLSVSAVDATTMMALGAGQAAAATILIVLAARHVRAAEVNLLAMVEAVLGPFWVWLAVGEEPDAATLWGGAIVLSSVAGFAVASLSAAAKESTARA